MMLKYFIVILVFFIFGCSGKTLEQRAQESLAKDKIKKQQSNEYIENAKSNYDTPGFLGLYLDMSKKQVNELVAKTAWGYTSDDYNAPKNDNTVFLKDDRDVSFWLSSSSGLSIKNVIVQYYENKIAQIIINGYGYPADSIERGTKDWGRKAIAGLKNKYGQPQIIKSLDDLNILDFKTEFYTYLYVWQGNNFHIGLCSRVEDFKYACSIIIQYPESMKKLNDQKKPAAASGF